LPSFLGLPLKPITFISFILSLAFFSIVKCSRTSG
jgi:hypothetical protein